ncbi:MAG: hypothetical protein U9M90_01740 [Patescibacteria group bacterium]|nr:hypothetical protein [Patescibacteria group bacterium]
MSEKKLFEKILSDQEKFDSEQVSSEIRREFVESEEAILNHILSKASPEEAENIQRDYDEYKKIEREIYAEKGEEMTTKDIKERIPNNFWAEMMYSETSSANIKDLKLPDFDVIWEKHIKEKDEEELREAKEKKRIN